MEGMEATSELPVPHDPQSNGGTEIGVKLVKNKLTTFRRCLESRIGYRVPPLHPLMGWLCMHVSMIVTYCAAGPDGLSAYHRLRGRPFSGRWVCFGEQVNFRRSEKDGIRGFKLARGIFLGMQLGGAQYALYDIERKKLTYSRSVSRLPDPEKFDAITLEALDLTPYDLHTSKEPNVVFKDRVEKEQPGVPKITIGRDI